MKGPVLAAGALSGCLLLAGCTVPGGGGTSGTSGGRLPLGPAGSVPELDGRAVNVPTTTVPVPAPTRSVDQADPSTVATAAVSALWTLDTATDESSQAGAVRAAAYCTQSYRRLLLASAPEAPPDAAWTTWAAHQAHTVVSVVDEQESGAPATTPSTAYRQLWVTVTPVGADGWSGPAEQWAEFVVLLRTGTHRWAVAGIETAP